MLGVSSSSLKVTRDPPNLPVEGRARPGRPLQDSGRLEPVQLEGGNEKIQKHDMKVRRTLPPYQTSDFMELTRLFSCSSEPVAMHKCHP